MSTTTTTAIGALIQHAEGYWGRIQDERSSLVAGTREILVAWDNGSDVWEPARRYDAPAVSSNEHQVAPAGTQGTYSKGMGSAEARVTVIGYKGGFTYVTFLDGSNKGITSKVPSSWVTVDPEPTTDEEAYANDDAMFGDAEAEPQSADEADLLADTENLIIQGVTDEQTTCDRCGKLELRRTCIVVHTDAGVEIGRYGTSCVSHILGRKITGKHADSLELMRRHNLHSAKLMLTRGLRSGNDGMVTLALEDIARYWIKGADAMADLVAATRAALS
jgi:hypothetical protein